MENINFREKLVSLSGNKFKKQDRSKKRDNKQQIVISMYSIS